ncbi:MAG: hypothetical protein IPO67_04275 [Deltaproteobacteria bacterium]|nr:hypothetical protein [Deltaproteobacteria bacterium]
MTHPLLYDDLLAVFDPVEYDSGWVPSGSPVAVAFRINAEGGAYTQMDGETGLTWPTALTQSFTAYEDGGLFALDAMITASVDMKIDLWGIYWEDALAEAGDSFYGEAVFTPWLLPGGALESVEAAAEGSSRELFNLEYEIFSGVGVYLIGACAPTPGRACAAFGSPPGTASLKRTARASSTRSPTPAASTSTPRSPRPTPPRWTSTSCPPSASAPRCSAVTTWRASTSPCPS